MSADAVITAIAIAVVRHGDSYLIGQRGVDVSLPGLWEFPGGKVRADELPADAAVRECFEETGLEVQVLELLSECEHTYPHGRLRLHFFLCAAIGAVAVAHQRFQWVAASQLPQYEFPAANRQIIVQLARETTGRE
jgi:mutator protein MutT